MTVRVKMCGPVELVAGEASHMPPHRIRRGVLAALALETGRFVNTERLITSCWEQVTVSAPANLRSHLSQLRGVLEAVSPGAGKRLENRRGRGGVGGGYRLLLADDSDVAHIQRHYAMARHELRADDAESTLRHCRAAEELWRGDFGLDLPDTPWFRGHATELAEVRQRLRRLACVAQIRLGNTPLVLGELRRVVASGRADGLDWVLWIAALFASGDTPAALAAFGECRTRYAELGLDVPRYVARLQQPILDDDKAAIVGSLARL